MSDYYARDGRPLDMTSFAKLHSDRAYKRVAETTVGPYWVSTVWLGLNHNWGEGPPLIFETMVFLADTQELSSEFDMDRYATEDEAKQGHEDMCLLIRATVQETLPEIEQQPKHEGC